MNETAAHDVLLVRAIETTDTDGKLLSNDDRSHATRTAAELARWRASEARRAVDPSDLLAERARLLIDKLGRRSRQGVQAAHALRWRPWLGAALPLLALIAGAALERLGDAGRINLLAFPLLALIAWNLAVYVALLAATLRGLASRKDPGRPSRGLRALLQSLALRGLPQRAGAMAPALGRFAQDWLAASKPLTAARIARVLHLAAAAFAVGALAGMYVRGLVLDYRAGWESTFLSADTVHALLTTLLGPAAQLLGDRVPDVGDVAALRFPAGTGENAARWIHWYALTVAVLVIVPRLLLAGTAALRERHLAQHFPLDLSPPYYRRLLIGIGAAPGRLRVVPYSYTLDEPQIAALRSASRQLLGEAAELLLRPAVAYGDETAAAQGVDATDAQVALTLALFNASATPERENHGAFLDALAVALPAGAPRAVLVDTGPYRRRLGASGGLAQRLDERTSAWHAFAAARGWSAAFIDLADLDAAALERALGAHVAT